MSRKTQLTVFGLFAVLGLSDAIFLTVEHYRKAIPPCSVTSGCQNVLTSQYSTVFGIPVSLFGAFFYATILVLTVIVAIGRDQWYAKLRFLTWAGLLASAWLVFVQLALLKAICPYCMVSALTSTVIWITGLVRTTRIAEHGVDVERNVR